MEAKSHPAVPPGHAAQASCRQSRASTDPDKVITALATLAKLAELAGLITDAVLAGPEPAQLGAVASAANPTSTSDSAELVSAHFAPNVDPSSSVLGTTVVLIRFGKCPSRSTWHDILARCLAKNSVA
ncbi:hypothetical protein JMJ35_010671 [Cladonia borealis]|uniref:Uncharacterized protein n=1 Tax=Cladonia borealis TaxID=184061 RepID=A0AA39QRB0_9LECA|nr:hypothetical protein JMJ35_010671 [Cladonia borealis]